VIVIDVKGDLPNLLLSFPKLDAEAVAPWLRKLRRKLHRLKWVVYCKRPFGGSQQVIRYLGRYTHRVAISNRRLVSIDDRGVTFRTRDGNTTTLEPVEFLRLFVAHVLPPRFVKIRHFDLLATGKAKERWQMAAKLLGPASAPSDVQGNTPEPSTETNDDWQSLLLDLTGFVMSTRAFPLTANDACAPYPPG